MISARSSMGSSFFTRESLIISARIIEDRPAIKARLDNELPMTLPSVNWFVPRIPERIPTTSSGALVPKATTVIPIIKEDIPYLRAILADESISISALLRINTNPKISKINCIKTTLFFIKFAWDVLENILHSFGCSTLKLLQYNFRNVTSLLNINYTLSFKKEKSRMSKAAFRYTLDIQLGLHKKGGKLIQALHPKAQNLEQIMLNRKIMIIIFNSFINVKDKMNPYCIITNFPL
jgi:hypothetical protein